MRPMLLLALLILPASASAQMLDGPVAGGAFGMSGADYFGDIHDRPPPDREATRARANRHRVASAAKPRASKPRATARRAPL
ncbi:hypothetical protein [Methylobacterium gregans]|uniref:Uncharacterized protein n=1 Tax=Methylobacterium gregans TaxID=374424 RepID=A0AA37MJG6_9HYPH|nr:hypothetical protein [Methylobacterium gregans]MDQ0522802.1 hypothetical protein [Methylobacterium gregans]GJD82111.1 hypothetical protein NBEOAGPD_5371 [Methylobacterium gregans]GLS55696.1 hypothetical protein GCM10007886_38810 [Methylobacterium gregans]